MPTYIMLFKWTDQGIRSVKDAFARNEHGRAMLEKAGGRLLGSWWTMGAYDVVRVVEFPDDETASSFALWAAMPGNVRTETMRAYTAEEMQRVIQKLP